MKREDILPELIKACPRFADYHVTVDFEGELLLYPRLGDLARYLLEKHKIGDNSEIRAVAQFIERMHLDGDDFVREAGTIGALESIQNVWGNAGYDPAIFREFLGPESTKWWDSLFKFWEGKIPYVGADLKYG